jgi:hypothetical protein
MNATSTELTVTGGSLIQDNISYGSDRWNTYYIQSFPMTPVICSGNYHVFGCDHAEKCKCGKAQRKVEHPKCPCCGKRT